MKQLRGYELKEAHLALERGGVVVDREEFKKLLTFQEVAHGYEKRISKLEKALKRAKKVINGLQTKEGEKEEV